MSILENTLELRHRQLSNRRSKSLTSQLANRRMLQKCTTPRKTTLSSRRGKPPLEDQVLASRCRFEDGCRAVGKELHLWVRKWTVSDCLMELSLNLDNLWGLRMREVMGVWYYNSIVVAFQLTPYPIFCTRCYVTLLHSPHASLYIIKIEWLNWL